MHLQSPVKTGSAHFYNAYKKARNELNSLIKSTKARYYNDALNQCKKDPKAMWKTLTEPEEIADSLNTYFNEIGSVLAKDLPKGDNSFEKYIVPVEKNLKLIDFLQLKSKT